jgi:hypothetical protein
MTGSAHRIIGTAVAAGWLSGALPAQEPVATFRSGTEVVLVPVWVKEGNKHVAGLTASDFQLFDSGVVQEISLSAAESQPVDVTLVIDTSGSVQGAELEAIKSGVQQIARSLAEHDRVRLLTFATSIGDAFGVRSGGALLPVDRIEGGGATSLYDAIAAALMFVPRSDRPQLVFGVSDGLDTLSFLEASQVASVAGFSGASLYVALVRQVQSGRSMPTPFLRVVERLREAAVRTGGLLFENPPGMALPALFGQAIKDFRTSYLLSYSPRGVRREGWHEIVVRTKDRRYSVRARTGYQN